MNDERKECTFLWLIENYSYCWQKNGEFLDSPVFFNDGPQRNSWYLRLYPRGHLAEDNCYISLFLRTRIADDGPLDFFTEFKLSIIAEDGSALNDLDFKYKFTKDCGYGPAKFAKLQDVLLCKKDYYLPQDTLKVLCKIWKADGGIQQDKFMVARTRIGIEQISFLHVIENFSSIEPDQKNTIPISSPSKNGLSLSTTLYYSDEPVCEGDIQVEIAPSKTGLILARCKISLMEKSGKEIECAKADNRYVATRDRQDIKKLQLSFSRQNILSRKRLYLPDDKLSLLYECTFSTGIESQRIEKSMLGLSKLKVNQICDNDLNNVSCDDSVKLNPSAFDEFKSLYYSQLLTDVEIKTKTKSFRAHKFVLIARSSVFQAMLTNDMEEKSTNCIRVDDLEDGTVQLFLHFLYADELENLQWDSAIKLYYAGDKYAIEKLKRMCASFLMNNVTSSTASELLLLADTHNDSHFKKSVEDFIFKHEEEVFGSEEWISLIETNAVLVSKTMCLKYTE